MGDVVEVGAQGPSGGDESKPENWADDSAAETDVSERHVVRAKVLGWLTSAMTCAKRDASAARLTNSERLAGNPLVRRMLTRQQAPEDRDASRRAHSLAVPR